MHRNGQDFFLGETILRPKTETNSDETETGVRSGHLEKPVSVAPKAILQLSTTTSKYLLLVEIFEKKTYLEPSEDEILDEILQLCCKDSICGLSTPMPQAH